MRRRFWTGMFRAALTFLMWVGIAQFSMAYIPELALPLQAAALFAMILWTVDAWFGEYPHGKKCR